ncbi:hypothetical protein CSPHI_10370 [Corynebacterium sphenisci DSM 44792]|uniref:Uncharacterized protein n=1 Tax=Corynebacterium sphenisci DSM 44792 TaxID=1437874 RepID=A0A1L7CZM3_9CORY|nr:hypothetical protein [Corynebacterium sphenisci]APT91335.1 hypothetical protein CSPHI_10370 [Corynebacterium sphenisci DSM 44792]
MMLTLYPRFHALMPPDYDALAVLKAIARYARPDAPFAVAALPPDCTAVRVARGRVTAAGSYRGALRGGGLVYGVPACGLTLVPTGAAAPALYDGHGRADGTSVGGVRIVEPAALGGAA